MADLYIVKATELNVRSSPQIEQSNKITSIPEGHVISKISVAGDGSWWQILTVKDGRTLEGFVASRFLEPAPNRIQAIGWFKEQFRSKIEAEIAGTPFSLDMLTAIALQETYYIWGKLYTKLSVDDVLKFCVGDTLDTPKRSAFPKNKAALLNVDKGREMFKIAREALEAVGTHVEEYKKVADTSPDKFFHGFGIFQLDLQFFQEDPDYFIQKRWYSFDECLSKCTKELKAALKRAYGSGKTALKDEEKVYVAIAYNRGKVEFSRKFKQGYRDDSGKYYGEYIWEYLQLAKSVP
ncbi:SH3 domain-containing protein [Microcoleus sp.]|uniref:SH3 domain-containing protein n=1 Tax=Microcoleus sp. TaxID=44472 RepID=UPI0035944864